MSIAKGSSTCSAERSFYIDTIRELINELQTAYSNSMASLQNTLVHLEQEGNHDSCKQVQEAIDSVEEKAIRLRNLIFSGLYTFWEKSLKEICSHYKLEIPAKRPEVKDYLSVTFGGTENNDIAIMRHNAKELRNYIVHGSLTESRYKDISLLAQEKPEWGIVDNGGQFFFSSYISLKCILDFIKERLNMTEDEAIKLYNTNKKNRNEQRD